MEFDLVNSDPIRPLLSFIVAFFPSLLLVPLAVRALERLGARTFHKIREDIDNQAFFALHQKKIGTPSMGGVVIILLSAVLGAALYHSTEVKILLVGVVLFSVLGLADDLSKLLVRAGIRERDLDAGPKFAVQWALGFLTAGLLYFLGGLDGVGLPLVGFARLSVWYMPIAAFSIVFSANAVNITDGLDGLAGGLSVIAFTASLVIALTRGNTDVAGMCAIIAGASLAFLFFNIYPARVFMGDVGSMGIGAGLGIVALLLNDLVPMALIAGVFVIELLSSLIQKIALRYGRRVFKIAPLHHHLEAASWPETRITFVFWLSGVFLGYAGVLVSLAIHR